GRLLRSDTMTSFTRVSQVLVIEVDEGTAALQAELTARGLGPRRSERGLLVRIDGDATYDAVRDAVADLGLPLNRLEQQRRRGGGSRGGESRSCSAATKTRRSAVTTDGAAPAGTGVIHDLGYQHYDGPRLGRPAIIRALAWHSLRSAFGIGRGAKAKIVPLLAF